MNLQELVFNALQTAKNVTIQQPARLVRKATTSIRIILVLLVVLNASVASKTTIILTNAQSVFQTTLLTTIPVKLTAQVTHAVRMN